jgi:RNA polymerase sigma factor (TIGR02999 family)
MRKAFPQSVRSLTLQPTAIANDAMLRVLKQRNEVKNPDQFFALAARFVHQLIVDYQRHRMAEKRGAGARGVDLDAAAEVPDDDLDGARDLDVPPMLEMLDKLREQYPRKAEVVSLHVLCGHPLPATAEMIGVSLATVERDWSFAKSWLAAETRDRKRHRRRPSGKRS